MKTWSVGSEMQKVCEWGLEKRWLWLSWCINRHPENLPADTVQFTEVGWDAETQLVICLGPISCFLSLVWRGGWWHLLFCHPPGYSGQDFDWADYQKQCGAEAAPHLCFRNVSSLFAFVSLLLIHVKRNSLHGKTAARLWEVPPDRHESVWGRKLETCFGSPSLKKRKKSYFCLYLIHLDFLLFISSLILYSI